MKLTNRWCNMYWNPVTNWYYLGQPYKTEAEASVVDEQLDQVLKPHVKCGTIEIAVDEQHQLVMVTTK